MEAICPNSPGCCGAAGAGCATLDAGLAAGTLEAGFGGARGAEGGALPKVGEDRPLDRLPPRGIIIIFQFSHTVNETLINLCKTPGTKWRSGMMQTRFLLVHRDVAICGLPRCHCRLQSVICSTVSSRGVGGGTAHLLKIKRYGLSPFGMKMEMGMLPAISV